MKYISVIILAFSIVIVSCKSKSVTNNSATQEKTETNSVLIDFYSKGSGINRKAYAKIDSMITEQKSSCNFDYNLVKYGREGERQICITNIPDNCKKSLIGIVNSFKNNELVRITENGQCRK